VGITTVADAPIDGTTYVVEELAEGIGTADSLVMVEVAVAVILIMVVLLPVMKNEVVVTGVSGCPSEDWVTYGLLTLEIPNWSVYW